MKILFIDDAPDIRALMTDFLPICGHTVVTAADGQQGWEIFSAEADNFDVLITDVSMPIMNGMELLQMVREKGFKVPVILVSGQDDPAIETKVAEYEIAALVSKPFELSEMQALLERLAA
jgi:DNA-binding response OmpR family regulator